MTAKGRLIGVGVGPGDPELLTLKALKALQQAEVIAYFARKGARGHARTIVAPHLSRAYHEEALIYPITTEIDARDRRYGAILEAFYAHSEARLRAHLDTGRTVALLSEGDPLFFGSYMHLHVRLCQDYDTRVIPGITAMSACWASVQQPFCQGREVVTVLSGTLASDQLTLQLKRSDAAVIMKVGRHLPRIRQLLETLKLLKRAYYIEYCGQPAERSVPLMQMAPDAQAPYLSLILIPGAHIFQRPLPREALE